MCCSFFKKMFTSNRVVDSGTAALPADVNDTSSEDMNDDLFYHVNDPIDLLPSTSAKHSGMFRVSDCTDMARLALAEIENQSPKGSVPQ